MGNIRGVRKKQRAEAPESHREILHVTDQGSSIPAALRNLYHSSGKLVQIAPRSLPAIKLILISRMHWKDSDGIVNKNHVLDRFFGQTPWAGQAEERCVAIRVQRIAYLGSFLSKSALVTSTTPPFCPHSCSYSIAATNSKNGRERPP